MGGLEIFLLVGLCSAIVLYFTSRTILNKKYRKITYLTPAMIISALSALFLISSFVFIKDGWVIMGNFILVIAIMVGSFIGTFLPFIHSKYRH